MPADAGDDGRTPQGRTWQNAFDSAASGGPVVSHTGNASAGNGAFVNTGNHTSTVRLPPEALRPPSEVDAHRSVDSDLPYRPDAIVDAGFVILRGEPVVAPRMLLQNEVQCENARFAIRAGAASVPHGR